MNRPQFHSTNADLETMLVISMLDAIEVFHESVYSCSYWQLVFCVAEFCDSETEMVLGL
jgi:hypothetical protein